MRYIALVMALGLATPAFADGHQPNLSDLITDTLGYVNVAPGVVIF